MNRSVYDILYHGIMRKQIEILKDESEILLDLFQLCLRRINAFTALTAHCGLIQIDQFPVVHFLQHRRASEQRRFTGSRRTDDRYDFALFHRERNIVEYILIVK